MACPLFLLIVLVDLGSAPTRLTATNNLPPDISAQDTPVNGRVFPR
jgi:hypothetical protein